MPDQNFLSKKRSLFHAVKYFLYNEETANKA